MCGIYGLLSARNEPTRVGEPFADAFVEELTRLVQTPVEPGRPVDPVAPKLLGELRGSCYRFVALEGFLELIDSPAARQRLTDAAGTIARWTDELEAEADRGGFRSQTEREQLNELIVGSRDLSWMIIEDALGNLEPVRALVAADAGATERDTWIHGWSLNLVLNGLDRLEVRGRDSAGLAVYARFDRGETLDRFLDELRQHAELGSEYEQRSSFASFPDRSIVRPESSDNALLFAFKVADEVGEMGDNVRRLRSSITSDPIFQRTLRVPGLELQILAHTRWASNGVVSLENCHPVDSAVRARRGGDDAARKGTPVESRGEIVAVLNGDIDNYQELYGRYVAGCDRQIDPAITTDAKIIPLVINSHYREGVNLEDAFRAAFDEFDGSMAIGVMSADRPGEFLFGQKGSGQGLYIGRGPTAAAVASEMYGIVELTQSYVKARGEEIDGGEILRISRDQASIRVATLDGSTADPVAPERVQQAEITTRDINRGEFPHFLLKETTESVDTVRKTIRGKFELLKDGDVKFRLGEDVLDSRKLDAFRRGEIRKIVVIGQGTAAVAGEGVASLLSRALRAAPRPIQVVASKATELSAHLLVDDMSDTLVVAISQSGTTTDTNRTVDLARERGAWILAIVNRRNSDLVYKSHGVLYTSDGRDIEMSVASTKAFYAQNVAGQILALALAQALDCLAPETLRRELDDLLSLPQAMEGALAESEEIRALADRFASRRSYWAVVGSGQGKIAADEIRIKLSELCYKSIATDFTEDKKHIDLSSEPLILVCTREAPPNTVDDAVKEVAIFKAHQSIPIVISSGDEDRFDPYAAGVIRLPEYHGSLGYLLTTMAGHLFGYHAASSFDHLASRLRRIRTGIASDLESRSGEGNRWLEPSELGDDLLEETRAFQRLLVDGAIDSCLTPATAVRLALSFEGLLGRRPLARDAARGELIETFTSAINELARPIDAIKHQAKTVTVGISRSAETRPQGPLWTTLRGFDLETDRIPADQRAFLGAFEQLVARLEGSTLYRVDGLDSVGRPRPTSTLRIEQKTGCSAAMNSRFDEPQPLSGTKWGVVRSGELYLGCGQIDHRKILILPIIGERSSGWLLLYHLEMAPVEPHPKHQKRQKRLRALAALRGRYDELRIAVTERNEQWNEALLDLVDNDALFFEDPDRVAEEIATQRADV